MSEPDQGAEREAYVHPIQLEFVAVRELFVRTYRRLPHDFVVPEDDVIMDSQYTGYNSESKTLQINARVHIGDQRVLSDEEEQRLATAEKWSLRLRVHLVGLYTVDEDRFPLDRLDEWANKGGTMVLFPYVREHLYSLTARCGIRPLILPVMQMPTIKIAVPEEQVGLPLVETAK